MTRNNREGAWKNIRRIELLYNIAGIAVLIIAMKFRVIGPIFWGLSVLAYMVGVLIGWRQYQVLDEFGKIIFLKSWMISGIVTSSSISLVVLWSLRESGAFTGTGGPDQLGSISLWAVYACLIAGLAAMGLTNLYLRRQTK